VKVDDEGVVDRDEDVPFGLGVTHVRLARDDRGLVDGLHGKDLTGVGAVNLTYLVDLTVGPLPEEPEDLEVVDPGRLGAIFFHCRFCVDVVVCEQRGVSVKTVAAILFFLIHRFRGREISFVDERGRRHVLLGGHGGRQPIGGHLQTRLFIEHDLTSLWLLFLSSVLCHNTEEKTSKEGKLSL
jgi:hypothetical protein